MKALTLLVSLLLMVSVLLARSPFFEIEDKRFCVCMKRTRSGCARIRCCNGLNPCENYEVTDAKPPQNNIKPQKLVKGMKEELNEHYKAGTSRKFEFESVLSRVLLYLTCLIPSI